MGLNPRIGRQSSRRRKPPRFPRVGASAMSCSLESGPWPPLTSVSARSCNPVALQLLLIAQRRKLSVCYKPAIDGLPASSSGNNKAASSPPLIRSRKTSTDFQG